MIKNLTYIFLFLLNCTFVFSQCDNYLYGDVNNDNSLDIIDIIIFVDVIFENQIIDLQLADLNFDLTTNIFDVIILIERILDDFPYALKINSINFDFHALEVTWEKTNDYGFSQYNLFYSNFIDNQSILLYSTQQVNDTTIVINDIVLNEQNFFWVSVVDFTGCELLGDQYIYELPFKTYELDNNGNILNTEFSSGDFRPAEDCSGCHYDHYNEWFSSMHSYQSRSPVFFSHKEEVKELYPATGERFCMQCHNPIAYLTGEETSIYSNPNDFQSSGLNQAIKDGITCDVCHTMTGISQSVFTEDNIAANAIYKMYPLGNIKFGPIENPEENDFHESYYLPTYESSQMCLPCHDLVVRGVEAEITFSEWARIPGFSMFDGVSCQECHMPLKENGYHNHKFVGVDMDLAIPPLENPLYEDVSNLLSTAAELRFSVWNDTIPDVFVPGEILNIPLTVESLTGHNLPSGATFNREAWIELVVKNNNQIIYSTGLIDNADMLNYSDENLLLFSSNIYDENNNPTNFVTELHSIENFTLGAYQERFKYYDILIPENIDNEIIVTARFLFRPFKPDLILGHHPEFIENLPIYEITSINTTIIPD